MGNEGTSNGKRINGEPIGKCLVKLFMKCLGKRPRKHFEKDLGKCFGEYLKERSITSLLPRTPKLGKMVA